MPKQKFAATTNPTTNSVVDSVIKPSTELHMLIGGPYVKFGKAHRYGHTALRVKRGAADTVYDFGRYGETTGTFGEAGEGILRVWSEFRAYIAGENELQRVTTAFVFVVFDYQADAIDQKILGMTKLGKRRIDLEKSRPMLKVFELATPYTALHNNCTTLSVDVIKAAIPKFDDGSQKFIKPETVMSWPERAAMETVGGSSPTRIFLPANLQDFLLKSPAVKPNRVETHGGK